MAMRVCDLKTGDHISATGPSGVDHHGIVDRRGGGGMKVIHACKDARLVIVSSFEEFLDGRGRVALVRQAEKGERFEIADRARELIGEPYSLLGANCEHLAYGASHGEAESPQLQEAAVAIGGVAVVGLLAAVFGRR